jgi:hypothetical protein
MYLGRVVFNKILNNGIYNTYICPALSVCLCVYLERSAGMPEGHARRARPKGAPKSGAPFGRAGGGGAPEGRAGGGGFRLFISGILEAFGYSSFGLTFSLSLHTL